ncbi:hypothetical protein B7R77_09710 [Ralstonia solanacearum K60]|uniref:Uncharacterized protein n=1 Tax=Ralstonia solanacearum K60 TaxID=1091042 RepID=A0AAP7ZNG0_RALSL|nr:hypothetical protein [Ralstonia solanacearum]OYQ13502.1 hypothetical protein B7R77_09710 [Ralstonia solanacearum K60]
MAHLELVAEAATKAVSGSAVAVAGGRTFAAGLPDDLLQACEFYLGLACWTVDQEAEGVDTGAGRFVPVCAAEPIAGALATL